VSKSNLTKEDIAKNLTNLNGLSLSLSKKLVDDLLMILIKKIKNDNFNLKNIGTFKIRKKKERLGRNPKTNEEFVISSRKSLSFIASKKLTDLLNKDT